MPKDGDIISVDCGTFLNGFCGDSCYTFCVGEVDEETKTYREMIDENISQINEFRNMIKNLESLNEAYKSILDNNNVKLTQANRETADLVNKLVNKKTF